VKTQNVLLFGNTTASSQGTTASSQDDLELLPVPAFCAKLADFNSVYLTTVASRRRSGFDDAGGVQVGTFFYRAPELIFGDRSFSKGVDVWAAAVSYAESALGSNPCQGETSVAVVEKIVEFAGGSAEGRLLTLQNAWSRRNGANLRVTEGAREEWRRRWLERVPERATYDLLQALATMSPPGRLAAQEALEHAVFWPLAIVKHGGEAIHSGGRGNFAVQNGKFSPRVLAWLLEDRFFADEALG
jgi:serine/threonine protein kinase